MVSLRARRCLLSWQRFFRSPGNKTLAQWAAREGTGPACDAMEPPAHPSRRAREGWAHPILVVLADGWVTRQGQVLLLQEISFDVCAFGALDPEEFLAAVYHDGIDGE